MDKKTCKIILDVGSCHRENYSIAERAILDAQRIGVYGVKFQLIPKNILGNNLYFEFAWLRLLKKFGDKNGIVVFASVFDDYGISTVIDAGCDEIKFAYSMRNKYKERYSFDSRIKSLKNVFTSSGFLDNNKINENEKILFCIPEYPVLYTIDKKIIDMVRTRFNGWSYHGIGPFNAIDIADKFEYLEIHYNPNSDTDIKCPDEYFALRYREVLTLACVLKSR